MNWLRRFLYHRPSPFPARRHPRVMRPCEHRAWLDVEMSGPPREQCVTCGGWRFKEDAQ